MSHDGELRFFEESDSYWKPASGQDEIYEQLADKKYREIQRRRIVYVTVNDSTANMFLFGID